jgi:hypothetical protein
VGCRHRVAVRLEDDDPPAEGVSEFTFALSHGQQAVRHHEAAGNRYAAGQSRMNIAINLTSAGRTRDAIEYAYAALRDFERYGEAVTADVRAFIADLERALAQP